MPMLRRACLPVGRMCLWRSPAAYGSRAVNQLCLFRCYQPCRAPYGRNEEGHLGFVAKALNRLEAPPA